MKVEILDDDLEELIRTGRNEKGKYRQLGRDRKFVSKLSNIYSLMCSLERTSQLREYSFLHYERLKHLRMSSVRIINGRVERLLFIESEDSIQISLIEINVNHYGTGR